MLVDHEILDQIRRLLDDKRSSGLPVIVEMAFSAGMQMSDASPEKVIERNESPVKVELLVLVDQLLLDLPVTAGCKAHIKELVGVYFNMGVSTDTIMDAAITCSLEVAKGTPPPAVETARYLAYSGAITSPEIQKMDAPKWITWGEEICVKYGETSSVRKRINRFRSLI